MAENIFGSTLEEIQKRAYAASAKRRQQAGMLAAQNSNRPGLHSGLGQAFHRLGASMFGGGQGSEEERLKAEEGEALTQEMRALDSAGTVKSAMETSRELFKRGATKQGATYLQIAQARKSMQPTSKYETWYNADGSSEQVQEINGIPIVGDKRMNPTDMAGLGKFKVKPTPVSRVVKLQSEWTESVNLNDAQRKTVASQLANTGAFNTIYGSLSEEKKTSISEGMTGRIEQVAQLLQTEAANKILDRVRNDPTFSKDDAENMVPPGVSTWSQRAVELYIEGGGLRHDTTPQFGADGVRVKPSALTLDVLRANVTEQRDRQTKTRATNAEWDDLQVGNSATESTEMNISKLERPAAKDLLLSVASGQASPEQAVAGLEAQGYTFVSDKHRDDQKIIMQKIKDTPEMSQLYFEEGVTTKVRDNNIDKYISELDKKGNIQGQLNALKLRQYFKRLQDKVTTPVGLGRGGKTDGIKGTSFWASAPSTYSGRGTIKNNLGN